MTIKIKSRHIPQNNARSDVMISEETQSSVLIEGEKIIRMIEFCLSFSRYGVELIVKRCKIIA